MNSLLHQIADAMAEVSTAIGSLDESTVEARLMSQAHTALSIAHSLVYTVNMMQLAKLIEDG